MRQSQTLRQPFLWSGKTISSFLFACLLMLQCSAMAEAQDFRDRFLKPSAKTTPGPSADISPRQPNLASEATQESGSTRDSDKNQSPLNGELPLQPREKLSYGLRKAFLSPNAYIRPGFSAYLRERDTVSAPGKDRNDRLADGLSSFARAFANRSTAQLFGSGVYPILFKQDPRYKPSNKEGVLARTLYAASRAVLTQGDNGKTQINYSKLAGDVTSASLANLYERDRVTARDLQGRVLEVDRQMGVGPTFRRFGMLMATGIVSRIVFDEFDLDGRAGRAFGRLFGGR